MTGDEFAFSELVIRQNTRIRNLFRKLTGRHALADDLAQITFVQAWKKIGQLKSPEAFGGWLHRIAIRVWLAEKNRPGFHSVEGSEFTDDIPDSAPTPDRTLTGMDLERALLKLRESERLCIVLSFGEGYTHSEISELSKLPLGTVKSHLLRASAKLRDILHRSGKND